MRSCGECTACCTALGVKELNKPAGDSCEKGIQIGHVQSTTNTIVGCSTYKSRPKSCRAFECAWLQGLVPMNPPDQIKVE